MRAKPPSFAQLFLATALVGMAACAPNARAIPLAPAPVAIFEPDELGEDPEVIEDEVRSTTPTLLGDVRYDLPLEANTWVEAELNFLVYERPNVIGRWLERGDYYEPFIKKELAEVGLPTDLYHLAMIESGFVPNARSRAGAVGLWQFMPATGRQMGLRVDAVVDERIDPVRSTRAAAQHLHYLLRRFSGDWPLAAAAYNAGAGRISRGIDGLNVDNFWDLAVWGDLAEETKHYVPRLYAMTIIARDRPRFGFAQPEVIRDSFVFDSMLVDVAIPLTELAAIGGLDIEQLAQLNPHLLQRATPPGTYWVWVPAGTGAAVQRAYLGSEFRRTGGYATYVVRRGDTLSRISVQSGVPAARIRALNSNVHWDRLPIGHRLRLPASGVRALGAGSSSPPVIARASQSGATASTSSAPARPSAAPSRTGGGSNGSRHVVRQGETLWSISRHYGVTVEKLKATNRLQDSTIVVGRTLQIPGPEAAGN